jgi:hypothetical protein
MADPAKRMGSRFEGDSAISPDLGLLGWVGGVEMSLLMELVEWCSG